MIQVFHLYGLLIAIGIALGWWVVEQQAKFFAIKTAILERLFPFLFIGALIGARIYHVVTDRHLYIGRPFIEWIAIWNGGVGFLGALIGGSIGVACWLWYEHRRTHKPIHLFTYLDLLVFGIPLAQAIGRVGNFVNKELYGFATTLPWGIEVNGERYHPLFLYEALANLMLFALLMLLSRKRLLVLGKGQYASLYLVGYGFIRFWLEFLRPETARFAGNAGMVSIAQYVAFAMMMIGTVLFWIRRHAPKKAWDISLE